MSKRERSANRLAEKESRSREADSKIAVRCTNCGRAGNLRDFHTGRHKSFHDCPDCLSRDIVILGPDATAEDALRFAGIEPESPAP